MNFKKISKEKRKQLFGVVVGTVAVIGVLWYLLIQGGYQKLGRINQKKVDAKAKLEQMESTIARAKEVETAYNNAKTALDEQEGSMASGDIYSWMHGTLRRFQRSYNVEIPQIGSATPAAQVDLIPRFPYKQSTVTVAGNAYYHELGRFIADFENNFPLMRIINLSIERNATPAGTDRNKLAFKMDIVALVKP